MLAENSRGLVELKAASLWLEAQGMALPGRLLEPALLEQTMAEYHRLAARLNRQFAVKASTQ